MVVHTDAPCERVDRIEVHLSRADSPRITQSLVFVRDECMASGGRQDHHTQLNTAAGLRLGVQDSRASDARLHAEVIGRHGIDVVGSAVGETDFVDNKVYALPVSLDAVCFDVAAQCAAGATCRADPQTGAATCVPVYHAPGTGTAGAGLTVDLAAGDGGT